MAFQAHMKIKGNHQEQFESEGMEGKSKDLIPIVAFSMVSNRPAMLRLAKQRASASSVPSPLSRLGARRHHRD